MDHVDFVESLQPGAHVSDDLQEPLFLHHVYLVVQLVQTPLLAKRRHHARLLLDGHDPDEIQQVGVFAQVHERIQLPHVIRTERVAVLRYLQGHHDVLELSLVQSAEVALAPLLDDLDVVGVDQGNGAEERRLLHEGVRTDNNVPAIRISVPPPPHHIARHGHCRQRGDADDDHRDKNSVGFVVRPVALRGFDDAIGHLQHRDAVVAFVNDVHPFAIAARGHAIGLVEGGREAVLVPRQA
mmetsp:Transcript_9963/g.19453  ORF Transcript_9963/g.19453 Transcript_9963/m.19453 type:complete len:240 (-) Transcript_9963:1073-1792(-)